jgi:hypothetical protein
MVLGGNAWGLGPYPDRLVVKMLLPDKKPAGMPGINFRESLITLKGDGRYASTSFEAQITAEEDPRGRQIDYATSLNHGGEWYIGEVVDGSAWANCYRVQLERGAMPRVCTELGSLSYTAMGPTGINSYVPGTMVLVYVHAALPHPYIVGVAPQAATSGKESIHDYITQTSRNRVDEGHKRYLNMTDSGGLANYSSWRPYDGTQGGEWGAISTTGLKVTLDDFLVQMAVSEFTGVFGFYHDQLLRVSGYNLQTWTAGHERDAFMDQCEYNDTQGYSPYPWEALGALKYGQSVVQEYDHESFALSGGLPYYAHWENKYDNLQPFHRTQQFYGYYGQGARTVVSAPPNDADWWVYKLQGGGSSAPAYASDIQTNSIPAKIEAKPGSVKQTQDFQDSKPPIGLAEDNTAMDGRRFIASAKGITIAKRMMLPAPTRMRRPEDGTGDDEESYKFAGKEGSGAKHEITGDFETNAKNANMQRAAGILDLHGYLFNYVGLHPFHWHSKDYKTWEQSELKYADCNQALPKYSKLKSSMYLPEPAHKTLDIDHRYTGQKFYQSEAFISLLEDGAVVIGDGYGAEIRMCAGSITISAPGDVWFKPGKNAQIWAGRDIIQRANGAVDISTTEKSVRIKAEKDVMILAGNDKDKPGGVLIESKSAVAYVDFEPLAEGEAIGDSAKFGGVILRAPESNIVTQTQNLYLRAGVNGDGGSIVLDANKGEADILTMSNHMRHYVGENGQICHFFSRADIDNPQVGNIFTGKENALAGTTLVNGDIYASGGLMAPEFLYSYGTVTGKNIMVAPCKDDCHKTMEEAKDKIVDYIYNKLPEFARQEYEVKVEIPWYAEKKPGNDRVIEISGFCFRSDADYRVEDDFELFEDRWQQYARIGGEDTGNWVEKPVVDGIGQETWPFPGKKKFTDPIFMQQDFNIVEKVGEGFRDKDRNSGSGSLADPYIKPKFKTIGGGKSINDGYMIIK